MSVVRATIRQMEHVRKMRIPSTITDILKKTSPPNIETIVTLMLDTFRSHAIAVTKYIDIVVEKIRKRAEERGIVTYAVSRNCFREDCFTCMGKFDAHYPHLITRTADGITKAIRSRDLRKFLESLGFDEEEVTALLVAIDVRSGLIKLSNYLALFYTRLGVVEVSYE